MFLCQYYIKSSHDNAAITDLAEILGCRYKVAVCTEGWIIALIADHSVIEDIREFSPQPQVISPTPLNDG